MKNHLDHTEIYRLLEERMGTVQLRQRLGIESDREALLFGQGRTFFHPENWIGLSIIIRSVFHATFLHRRGRRNALNIDLKHNTFRLNNLPSEFNELTILHISDLHLDMNDEFPHTLAERVTDLDYDICILTGDFRYRTFGPCEATLEGMERVRLHLRDPVYGVLGNHDSIYMVPRLEEMGIHMLMNESVAIRRDGATLYLAGIDDPHYYRTESFERACRDLPQNGFSILLAHSPEVYRHAAHAGFDVMFCGHTHGGQICLPGGTPITVDTDCPRKFCVGVWRYHQLQGYTSTGAGSSIVDLRFNNRPEVTLHHLMLEPE